MEKERENMEKLKERKNEEDGCSSEPFVILGLQYHHHHHHYYYLTNQSTNTETQSSLYNTATKCPPHTQTIFHYVLVCVCPPD